MYIYGPQTVTSDTAQDAVKRVVRDVSPLLAGYEYVTDKFVEVPRSAFAAASTDEQKKDTARSHALCVNRSYVCVVTPGEKTGQWIVYPAVHGD